VRKIFNILIFLLPFSLTGQIDSALYYSHVDTQRSNEFLLQHFGSENLIPDEIHDLFRLNYLFGREEYTNGVTVSLGFLDKYHNNPYMVTKITNMLSRFYNKTGDTDKSMQLSMEVIYDIHASSNDIVIALNNIADILLNENKTIEALNYLKYANLVASNQHCPDLAISYLYLSFAYASEGINNKLEFALQMASKNVKTLYNPVIETKILNNIGVYHFINEEFDSARYYFNALYSNSARFHFYDQKVISLFNLSNIEYNSGNLEGTLMYLDSVMNNIEYVNRRLLSRIYYTYGVVYHDQEQHQKAIEFLNQSVEIALESDNHNMLLLSYEILAESYAGAGLYEKAYNTQKSYSILSDSINDADRLLSFDIFESEIDLLEKNNKIIRQDLDLRNLQDENTRIRNRVAITIAVALIIIILIVNFAIIYILRKRYTLKKQFTKDVIHENETFRARIASDLHDDIGQQLALIMHRESITSDPDLKKKITTALESVRSLSKLVYPQTLNIMGLVPLLRKMLADIEENQHKTTLLFADEEIESLMNPDVKLNTFRILQECISNSVKHSNADIINIKLRTKNDLIIVNYNDNGKQPENKKLHHGFGLSSMNMRAEMIDARIDFSLLPSGFSMVMSIPVLHTKSN
jgi:signal transduction histidine kinase